MKFTFNGTQFTIRFYHGTTRGLYPMPTTRYTLCKVFEVGAGDTRHVYASGQADCHPNDMYCYEVGRKLALARALEGHPKPFRTAVWGCYINRKAISQKAGN